MRELSPFSLSHSWGPLQIIARAHAHGLKVILATMTPFLGTTFERPAGESVRLPVNAWIPSQREADGVIDFDLVVRDPKDPGRMRADYQSGDCCIRTTPANAPWPRRSP